jgi:Tol biopolymer transport system component
MATFYHAAAGVERGVIRHFALSASIAAYCRPWLDVVCFTPGVAVDRPLTSRHDAPAPGAERLESWKEIAEYLHRDVRTVQRWERTRALPVRRLPGGVRARIYALRAELDTWWESRGIRLTQEEEGDRELAAHRRQSLRWLLVIGLASAFLLTVLALLQREWTPADSLRPVALTSYPGIEISPALSPDGNRVAFCWNGENQDNFDIYVKQIGVPGTVLRLTTNPLVEGGPSWSTDDRWIAFWRQQPTGVEVILVPSLGGPERKLTDLPVASVLSWTPDSKWLVFGAQGASGEASSIWAMQVDTGERRRLTRFVTQFAGGDSALGDTVPSISPDGSRLAFARQLKSYVYELYLQRLTRDLWPEGGPVKLTDRRYAAVSGIAWTGSSREVVYSAGGVQMQSLWRIPVSGKRVPKRLPYAVPAAIQPAISGSRHRLAYSWWLVNANVWRLDIRTGERKVLLSSTYDTRNPHYSEDGRKIVFQSNRSGNEEIWTCAADGSSCLQITSFEGPLCGAPRWSPDGRSIAFDSRAEGQPDIYVIAADGGTPRRLTNHPGNDIAPSWSHDGSQIYFTSDRTGRYELWRVAKEGGEPVQITRSGGFAGFESPDGKYIYYTKSYITSSPSRYMYQGLFNLPGHFHEGLYRMPAQGGTETQVFEGPVGWLFGVTPIGVYFQVNEKTIQFLEASTGGVATIATFDRPIAGVNASQDGAYVVWSQLDRSSLDLMLVEGFK